MADLDLFNEWKKKQDKESFQNLYMDMKPEIENAARKASLGSNIPQPVHKIWAAQSFYDALHTYKPEKGASLKTHVWNSVQGKANRLNYEFQNLGNVPETRVIQVGRYQNELAHLTEKFGREPSAAELADRLGIGIKDVERLRKEVQRDLTLGEGGVGEGITFEKSIDEEILNFLYYELGNEERIVYEHIFGKNGKTRAVKSDKRVDYDRISQLTGFSTSKVRAIAKRIGTKLDQHLRR